MRAGLVEGANPWKGGRGGEDNECRGYDGGAKREKITRGRYWRHGVTALQALELWRHGGPPS